MQLRLREILQKRGLSFRNFADSINVHPTSIPVTDKFSPCIVTFDRYADALGIPVWELLYDCGIESTRPFVPAETRKPVSEIVNERIGQLLVMKGMSAKRLAEQMGVSQQSLWQNMKRQRMCLNVVENIARGLGVELWELFATREEVEAEVNRRKADRISALNELIDFDRADNASATEPASANTTQADSDLTSHIAQAVEGWMQSRLGNQECVTFKLSSIEVTLRKCATA